MTTYFPPKKNTAFVLFLSVVSQANTKIMQSSPTIAAGDFKVSIDGGALNNLATLPVVTPAASKMIKVDLSAAEMNGDNITVVCSDAAGAEWSDLVLNLQTTARQIDDLAFPTVSGRALDVTATGAAGIDWGNVENPTTALNLSATNIDVDQVVASVSGAVGSVTGSVGSVTGAVGSVTGNVGGNVTGSVGSVVGAVGSVAAGVTVTTNNDKTGYSLSAAAIQAIWDALTAAFVTVGSIGKLLADNINATISSRSTVTTAQVNAEVVDALVTDTYAEPAAVPAATASLKDKIGWLAILARNKRLTTGATDVVRDDADAVTVATSAISDNGVTFTRNEYT